MMRHLVLVCALVPLAGCAALQEAFAPVLPAEPEVAPDLPAPAPVEVATLDPTPPPPPPPAARTAEEFDTTSAEDRAAAVATPAPATEERLGTTIASLGSPTVPGIWIETPLVDALTMGRVEVAATGKTVTLELRPSGGAAGSGSQISLAAMRLLEVPLTDLPELVVYRTPGAPS